ncbi:MAG: PepSY domain-containing protein [Clostridia bacterium]|nr:PepSY domain-containing protein [Clostridia bacterium]
MPAAEARKLALELIGKQQALPLEDTAQYRHTEEFDQEGWYFSFLPRNLTQPTCHVSFDHAGEVIDCIITPQHWETFTEKELMDGMNKIYGYRFGSQLSWEQDAWHVFGQMLPQAEKSEKWTAEYDAYLKTTYPLPEEGDMEKAAAQKIAQQKANLPVLYESVALMMETDGRRIWKVTLAGQTDKEEGVTLTYEMDAKTGEILLEKNLMDALHFWARYVPYSVYESCIGDMMSREEALDLAVKAIHSQPGGENIPLLDENCYTYTLQYNEHFSRFTVRFQTKKLEYGNCRVNVNLDGTTNVNQFEKPGLTGDNAYKRFDQVYGSVNDWDQSTWQLLDETMDTLEPTTFEGILLKNTHYPAEDSVKISRKEALDIIYQTGQKGYVDIIRSVLIDAQPNPVWKAYMADETGCYLIEVDANTGEVVDKMPYKADNYEFDNPVQIYTLRRDYAPAAIEEYGKERMAGIAITKAVADMELDDPSLPILYDSQYETKVDGDTVTFLPLHEGDPTYVLTFSDNYTKYTYTKSN